MLDKNHQRPVPNLPQTRFRGSDSSPWGAKLAEVLRRYFITAPARYYAEKGQQHQLDHHQTRCPA